ncbi:hypothetical protein [Bosea sp. 685]|uniref:hypothetical protein n=1 Tax=Bosea sp. 685 TaxID=3080057 RepID=UPI0028936DCE|nr:hypothetical protein [Bosea sp. 685]WNJ88715.1 hypothetical protein RMR04_20155 [Bosea sp. 685]
MSVPLDIVALYNTIGETAENIRNSSPENLSSALNAIASAMNVGVSSVSTLMNLLGSTQLTTSTVQAALGQISRVALTEDFATSLVGLYNIYISKGTDSTEFSNAAFKLFFQVYIAALLIPTGFGAAGLAFSLAGIIWDFDKGSGPVFDLYKYLESSLKRVIDPLVFDLDGDGISLISIDNANNSIPLIHFDYDNDGFAELTGWVSPNDGMLALDLNNNGTIDNGAELFGTPSRDGYEVLETYDTYRDGVIDAKDAIFADLKIWRDLDSDGITDAGELQTLAEAGITSISLTRTDVQGTNAGHDRGFAGSFTRADGTTGSAETIYFQTDPLR